MKLSEISIAVIGLGYVGLPLAVEFGKKLKVIGFDINQTRINDLNNGVDSTLEIRPEEFKDSTHLSFTTNLGEIKNCEIFIITVPTPIDKNKKPDFFLAKTHVLLNTYPHTQHMHKYTTHNKHTTYNRTHMKR